MVITGGSIQIQSTVASAPSSSPPANATTQDTARATPTTIGWTNGAAANQINAVYRAVVNVPSASPQTIDLRALTDAFGAALSIGTVKQVIIENVGTNAGTITATTSGADGWVGAISGTCVIPIGGQLVLVSPTTGWATSASSKEIVLSASGGNSPDVRVLVCGVKSA
jgi:hypothetical protein